VPVEFIYRGHHVLVWLPKNPLNGRYTIRVGTLVKASPLVKQVQGTKRIRVFWDKNYGERFNKLLKGALNQFFKEIS
jgi:hypothetical protein